jgi:hypothetical protein
MRRLIPIASMNYSAVPAKAGIQGSRVSSVVRGPRLREGDKKATSDCLASLGKTLA